LRELFCVVEKENCSDQPGNHGISVDEVYKHFIFMLRSRNIARDINENNFGSLLRAAFLGTIVAKKRRVNCEGGKQLPQLRQFTYLISAVARTDGFSETVCSDNLHFKTLQAFS